MKKSPKAIAISIGTFLALIIAAYAVTSLFYETEKHGQDGEHKTIFRCEISGVPESIGEVGPGDVKSVSPIITSAASTDMYPFIKVEMPLFSSAGLYTYEGGNGWSKVLAEEQNGTWVEVYRYDDVLTPESTTTPMATGIKMVDMGLAQYAEVTDLRVEYTGYCCSTEDGLDGAWDAVREHFGL